MTGQDWLEKDFYKALGVPKDADAAAIKKAYRKLARTYHPDHNPGDAKAEERFKEIGEAYAVLSDPEQRQQYDSLRAMAGGGPRFASGPGGASAGGFEDMFGGMFGGAPGGTRVRYSTDGGAGFEDILGGLFGGGFPGGASGSPGGPAGFGAQKGADITTSARLPFRSAVEGATVTLTLQGGRSMNVRIPAGVHDGQRIRLAGQGSPGQGGGPAGDLVVKVGVDPHPVYGISGNNLTMTLPVTFAEAVRGATVSVPTLDGKQVRLKIPAGTASGSRLRVKGKGVPAKKGTGDLMVTIEVAVPRKVTKEAKQALDSFEAATAQEDPRAGLVQRARA